MIERKIGLYGEQQQPAYGSNDLLLLEIAEGHIACMVKQSLTGQLIAFELFEINDEQGDWNNILYHTRAASQILARHFTNTHIYFNFAEAALIPADKLGTNAGEDFLNLLFGDFEPSVFRYERIQDHPSTVCIYRIKQTLADAVGRNFLIVTSSHVYAKLMQEAGKHQHITNLLVAQVYHGHVNFLFRKAGQVHVLQSKQFKSDADLLYHLLNISQQLQVSPGAVTLFLSGLFNADSDWMVHLRNSFGSVRLDEIHINGVLEKGLKSYPAYYLSPILKLVV